MKIDGLAKKPWDNLCTLADDWFSRAVRLSASQEMFAPCFTCHRSFDIRAMDCGHFMSRSRWALRYDLRNCRPQCTYCNRNRNGEGAKFGMYLGEPLAGELIDIASKKRKRFNEHELAEVIVKYRDMTNKLLKEKCVTKWW